MKVSVRYYAIFELTVYSVVINVVPTSTKVCCYIIKFVLIQLKELCVYIGQRK